MNMHCMLFYAELKTIDVFVSGIVDNGAPSSELGLGDGLPLPQLRNFTQMDFETV